MSLDHLNGRCGYVTLIDALNSDWNIFDYRSSELLKTYPSIDALIEDGWEVST